MDQASAIILTTCMLCGLIGMGIGSGKGKAGSGFLLGLLLGPIGLIIVAVLSPTPEVAAAQQVAVARAGAGRACPWCAEPIQRDALVCKHCGRDAPRLPDPNIPGGTDGLWMPDPSGRHPDRYWDGANWTKWVRDKPGGTRSEDPAVTG